MESTPTQDPPPLPPPPQPLKSSASISKLPVKRRIPDSSSFNSHPNPNFLSHTTVPDFSDDPTKPPPFKFHRIWTEPDEIRFLQGLLDGASDCLVFPRDLHIFYDRFSTTMSQPYTKSQLSEKLRRLRKKFRVISSRLSRGLDPAMLSPHDRSLYELSNKLWSPEFSSVSPFLNNLSHGSGTKSKNDNDSIGARASLTLYPNQYEQKDAIDGIDADGDENPNGEGDLKIPETNLFRDLGHQKDNIFGSSSGLGTVATKAVFSVFDESLKEVRMALLRQGLLYPDHKGRQGGSGSSNSKSKEGNEVDLERRWQEQRAVELEVFARRLRLVLENSLGELGSD